MLPWRACHFRTILLAEMKEIAERPTLAELRDRLHKRKPVSAQLATARLVPEEREARFDRARPTFASLCEESFRLK